jgi:hypothetical protein
MLIKVFASGTNVQRLAKGSGRADGVIYTAYSQLEQTEDNIVKRKFYMLEVDTLKKDVETLDEKVQPSWTKIWAKPYANKAFITELFKSFVGENELRTELNLSNITNDNINMFMLLVSANNKEMSQIKKIADEAIPNYHVKVLNGDYSSNKQAEYETIKEMNEARIAGKEGMIVIANQMGSRSYSVPAIQASIIAYDRGSVDATNQKTSRPLTPPTPSKPMWDGSLDKEFGYIVDLSFDPNRSENIERLLVDEIIMVQKSEGTDFPTATSFVLSSVNCFKMRYGTAVEVTEEDMFDLLGDNENLLRVADVTVDVNNVLDLLDDLANIKAAGKQDKKTKEAINTAKNKIIEGEKNSRAPIDSEKKELEKIINNAVRALNMSATSVFNLAGTGNSYRECIEAIASDNEDASEFKDLFGVSTDIVETILDRELLNEPILDVIVQNTKNQIDSPFI